MTDPLATLLESAVPHADCLGNVCASVRADWALAAARLRAAGVTVGDAGHVERLAIAAAARLEGEVSRLRTELDACTEAYAALAAPPPPRIDPERLARAIDAHNEQEEPFSPVHCNSGDDCHAAIAREYEADEGGAT